MPEMQVKKFEPVPKGTYLVSVKECKYIGASDKVKDPFYSWQLEILDEPLVGEIITFAGGLSFSPNTKTFKFLVATGILDPTVEEGGLNTDDYIGAQLYVDVDVIPQTGGKTGMRNKITDTRSVAAVEELVQKVATRQAAAPRPATATPAPRPAAPATRPAAPATRPAAPTAARPAVPTRVTPMSRPAVANTPEPAAGAAPADEFPE